MNEIIYLILYFSLKTEEQRKNNVEYYRDAIYIFSSTISIFSNKYNTL